MNPFIEVAVVRAVSPTVRDFLPKVEVVRAALKSSPFS